MGQSDLELLLLARLRRGVQVIYDPTNLYMVHLDRKSDGEAHTDLNDFIAKWDNAR